VRPSPAREAPLSRWTVIAALLAVTCTDGGTPPIVPTSLSIHAGDTQAGEAGQALAESLAVVVRDDANAPVQGVTVAWAVASGGGSVAPATSVTNSNGIARALRTLGAAVGPQTATATVAALGVITFTSASRMNGGVNLGNRTIGPLADTTLGTNDQPLVVMVTNEKDEPVPGVVVTWSASGGGSVSATSQPTDAGGESIVMYTYGPTAGNQFAQASVTGLIGSPIDFTLSAFAGNAVSITKTAGDNLAAAAGSQVIHRVVTRDARNNPRNGVAITWTLGSGGGSISPAQNITGNDGTAEATRTLGANAGSNTVTAAAPDIDGAPSVTFTATSRIGGAVTIGSVTPGPLTDTTLHTRPLTVKVTDEANQPVSGVVVSWSATAGSLSASTSTTNASGESTVQFTHGSIAGREDVEASVTGLIGSPVQFTLNATAGNPVSLSKTDGDNLMVQAGMQLSHTVMTRDARGNARGGVTIDWAAATGGGSVTPTQNVTSALGAAAATRTLGSTVGTQTTTAAAPSIPGAPVVTFTTTALTPTGTTIAVSAGDNQVAEPGQPLADSLAVIIRDASSNPLSGLTVTWAVVGGVGSVSPTSSVTGANGIARTRRTLGAPLGQQSTTATTPGIGQVSFTSFSRIQGATTLANATIGPLTDSTLASRTLSVVAKNEKGETVEGVLVNWSASNGGSVSAPSQATGPDGTSSVQFTYGSSAGTQNAEASVNGLGGSPISFILTATAGNPTFIGKLSGDNLTFAVGGEVLHRVLVTDARGNAREGVTIDWATASGGGSIDPAQNTTDVSGIAGATRTLGGSPGAQTATATAPAIAGTNQVTFTTNAVVPPTIVQVSNNFFSPSNVTISVGGSVTWEWQSNPIQHNVTFAAAVGAPSNIANRSSGSEARTFNTAGTFNYTCTIHGAAMSGSVTVNP
jgi:plastocyanin